ncbi:hypothetical protein ABEG17_02000 [Pedococcus sp. KACC 23699]|uniref:GNAT family N-acetyltransferase n=1 Tax=Pedococcus sp. KACC 23699 TaxID=3149228 RepID=A0AAU7JVA0_9MICO
MVHRPAAARARSEKVHEVVNPYYARLGFRPEGDHWVADLA